MTKPSLIADLIERLDEDRRYEFEERAGIIEFDAEQTRDQAELLALVDLLREHPAALVGITAVEVRQEGKTFIAVTTDLALLRNTGFTTFSIFALADLVKSRFGGLALLTVFP